MWSKIKNNYLILSIFIITFIISNWTLITKPMFYTHDYLHGARIAEYQRGLLEGQFPVIWSQNFGYGFGMPLFQFYAPLPYAIGALFYLLGFNLLLSVKIIFIISNIMTLAGGYLWAREFYSRPPSALASAFLTLATYRATDIFARGALSEVWAIMALPWLFLGVTRIIKGQTKSGFWLSVMGGVILALSHNLTTLITLPLITLYTLALMFFNDKFTLVVAKNRLKILFLAGLAVFGLSAFYLIPAFIEKNYTQVELHTLSDYYDYRLHFLYWHQFLKDHFAYGGSGYGPHDNLSFFLGWAQLIGLFFTLGALNAQFVKNKYRFDHKMKWTISLGFLTLCSMWLSTFKSQWIWKIFASLLKFVQFPWRFLGLIIIFLSLFSVAGLSYLPQKYQNIFISLLFTVLIVTSAHYFQGEAYLDEPAWYQADPRFISQNLSGVLIDYLPRDFVSDESLPVATEATKILHQTDQPLVKVDKMHQKLYLFDYQEPTRVEFALANYPQWEAEINGEKKTIKTSPTGHIVLDLPAGEVAVGLKLTDTPCRFWSKILSLITALILIKIGLYRSWPQP